MTGTLRAVKVVRREDFEREKTFEREFEGIKRYEKVSQDHQGLVDVLHVGRDDTAGFYYYVMELADDQQSGPDIDMDAYEPRTLSSDLHSRRQRPVAECVEVGVSLAEALGHLHAAGLTHRDVKPSNVIFVKGLPKLADVGLVARSGRRTFVGTEGYVPPEGPGTESADLYSLAMVLYEMGTGKDRLDFPELPTNLELPPTVNRDEWRELNAVICRAGAPDPRKRTESGEALARQLRGVVNKEEMPAGSWKKWAALFLVLAVAGGASFGAYRHFAGGGGDESGTNHGSGENLAGPVAPTEPEPGPTPPGDPGHEGVAVVPGPDPPEGETSELSDLPFEIAELVRNPVAGGGSISSGFNGADATGGGEGVVITDPSPESPDPEEAPAEPPPEPAARLKITRPPGAAVFDGEEQIDVTPTGWLEFDPGNVRLVLRKSGFLDYVYERNLGDGRTMEGSIRMKADHRPVIGQNWENSFGIAFEHVGNRHICSEIPRGLFDRFLEEEQFPFTLVTPVDFNGADENSAFADDRSMWAFCDWMTRKDRENGFLGRDQYYAAQRFSSEGETQAFFCRIEDRFGRLQLNSEPEGAEVYRHGDLLGLTPLSLSKQRIGRHEFVMKLPGHRDTPGVLEGIEGDLVPLNIVLERDNSVLFGEPWKNSLGVKFVPMGNAMLVAIWETRVEDYAAFLKSKPDGIKTPKPGFEQEPDHPVAGVTAEEARRFCRWLTETERKQGLIRPYHDYRLPYDHEWSEMAGLKDEKGTTPEIRDVQQVPDHFPWGSTWAPPDGAGNFADVTAARTQGKFIIRNYDDGFLKTAPVGSFKPNALGLYDLAGNVWEWVHDKYGPNSDLIGVRGGGWSSFSRGNLLTSYRNAIPPDLRDGMYGFRVVLVDNRNNNWGN